jgi:hypothetical protein
MEAACDARAIWSSATPPLRTITGGLMDGEAQIDIAAGMKIDRFKVARMTASVCERRVTPRSSARPALPVSPFFGAQRGRELRLLLLYTRLERDHIRGIVADGNIRPSTRLMSVQGRSAMRSTRLKVFQEHDYPESRWRGGRCTARD